AAFGLTLAGLPAEPPKGDNPPQQKAEPAPNAREEMSVGGRVLDAEGKPFAAAVAVVVEPKVQHGGGELASGEARVVGRGKADASVEGSERSTAAAPIG